MPKKEFRLNIEGATPEILPMARLAEYLTQLAVILGNKESVHFLRVEEGSARCIGLVDEAQEAAVIARVRGVSAGDAPKDALDSYERLHRFLKEDERSAELEVEDGEVVLAFPLHIDKKQETFGPFWQDGTLEGILMRIGGLDVTAHAHLIYQGTHYVCETNHEIAKELGHLLYRPIRVRGRGRWYRNADGDWELMKFEIQGLEELDDATLLEVVSRLRAIPDNDLLTVEDPLEDMNKLRHGEE